MRRRIRESTVGKYLGITQRSWRKCVAMGTAPEPCGQGWSGGMSNTFVDYYDTDVLDEWIKNPVGTIRWRPELRGEKNCSRRGRPRNLKPGDDGYEEE